MKLTEQQVAEIICGSQDDCMHRKTLGVGGQCGDCRIPAYAICAIEAGAPLDEDRVCDNYAAQRFAVQQIR